MHRIFAASCQLNDLHQPSGAIRDFQGGMRRHAIRGDSRDIGDEQSFKLLVIGNIEKDSIAATFFVLPRPFLAFFAEAVTFVPFLWENFLPPVLPEKTFSELISRFSHFSRAFETPNSFAVSSAVANFECNTIVILTLSFYDTLLRPQIPSPNFIFIISPCAGCRRLCR